MSICIFASKVAVILGNNSFKVGNRLPLGCVFEDNLKRVNELLYNRCLNKISNEMQIKCQSGNERKVHLCKKYNIENEIKEELKKLDHNNVNITDIYKTKQSIKQNVLSKIQNTEDKNEISLLIDTECNVNYGKTQENESIQQYEKISNTKVHSNNKAYKKYFELINSQKWCLYGKIDGISNNRIQEYKNRTNCFFDKMRAYEYDQIQCYMYLCDVKECEFIQMLSSNKSNIRSKIIGFDNDYFYGKIVPICHAYAMTLNDFLKESKLSDYLQQNDINKDKLIRENMKKYISEDCYKIKCPDILL